MIRALSLLALLPLGQALAAEIPLYPTGPSEDSAFLRFFNAGEAPLELNLEPMIASLVEILREDGFHDIRLLSPRGYCGLSGTGVSCPIGTGA